jgi:hypothetical protein
MKQTAVQILIESINDRNLWTKELRLEAEQALQMEREQMLEASISGSNGDSFEVFYNNAFKP